MLNEILQYCHIASTQLCTDNNSEGNPFKADSDATSLGTTVSGCSLISLYDA